AELRKNGKPDVFGADAEVVVVAISPDRALDEAIRRGTDGFHCLWIERRLEESLRSLAP
ncbi:MAG: hypothetical protein Q9180_004749, partial [Flavoplaca navasiana]